MAFFGVLFVFLLLCVIFFVIVLAAVAGAGATAVGAGGLASTAVVKDPSVKQCTAIATVAILLFAFSCFAFLGDFLWHDLWGLFVTAGFLAGAAIMVLAIVGMVSAVRITRKAARILFIVLFSLAIGLSVLALIASAAALLLFSA